MKQAAGKQAARGAEEIAERDLKTLSRLLKARGLTVRREKLVRGSAFRAKSGRCQVFGEAVVFLDKALPAEQQLSLLLDFMVERRIDLSEGDLSELSPIPRTLFRELRTAAEPENAQALVTTEQPSEHQ